MTFLLTKTQWPSKETWFLFFGRNLENSDIVILHYQNKVWVYVTQIAFIWYREGRQFLECLSNFFTLLWSWRPSIAKHWWWSFWQQKNNQTKKHLGSQRNSQIQWSPQIVNDYLTNCLGENEAWRPNIIFTRPFFAFFKWLP